jgi:short-chain Z-isoprenyl diphosphate synthase
MSVRVSATDREARIAVGNPEHLAVILDGNRRWARTHAVAMEQAYLAGAHRVVELAAACHERGIRHLTVWALSRENLDRPAAQLEPLLAAVTEGLGRIAATRRWRLRHLGDPALLPPGTRTRLRALIEHTAQAGPGVLNVAIAYSGRRDLTDAVRSLIVEHEPPGHPDPAGPETADAAIEDELSARLATAGQPDPDLVVRTSGELRLSGFMPWQAAYAELYFSPVDWPDFDAAELDRALDSYRARDQRHGL